MFNLYIFFTATHCCFFYSTFFFVGDSSLILNKVYFRAEFLKMVCHPEKYTCELSGAECTRKYASILQV